MVPNGVRVPVEAEYVFPAGCLGLSVDPVVDFERRGEADSQARDKESGERLWAVKVLDLDPEAGKFGGGKEVKVRIASAHAPVLPASRVPGYPPMVAFTGLLLVPWVDSQRCHGSGKCRARLAWSVRAEAVVDPATGVVGEPVAEAAASGKAKGAA